MASRCPDRGCPAPYFSRRASVLAQGGGCTPYIGTTYKSFIRQARENPDPNIRYIAYAKLGSPSLYEDKVQKDEAVRIMIAKLEDGREPTAIRTAIIRSLGNLGDRRARTAILRGVSDTDNGMIRVGPAGRSARSDCPRTPRRSPGS